MASNPSIFFAVLPHCAASARALVTPCPRPLWKPFWLLLLVAFALRLAAAWHGHWFWRFDESFQYLEQAHRAVFGYGVIPWEYRHGARSWLVPGMVMPPLYVAKWLGVDHPWAYATMVNSWNALLSLSIPIGTYFIARRLLSEPAARWAFVFTCFWYEFIILAPRTLAEIYSAYFFITALALGAGAGRARWLGVGFLLGLMLAFRPHYAPLAMLAGAAGVWQLPRRCVVLAVCGGVAALLLWGLVDKLTWGGWWISVVNYHEHLLRYFILFSADAPWWRHSKYLAIASFGLYPLIGVLALFYFRQLWLPWLLVAVPLVIYQTHSNQEYSNLFLLLPFLWLMAAGIVAAFAKQSKKLFRFGVASVFAVSAAGGMGALPNLKEIFRTEDFFSTFLAWQVMYKAHDAIEVTDDTVLVMWQVAGGLVSYGGFYALHHNIPVLYLSPYLPSDVRHHEIWEESGRAPMHDIATHVISTHYALMGGDFDVIPLTKEYALHINKNAPRYDVRDRWLYDYISPPFVMNNFLPPPPYGVTPYNPDL